MKERNVTIDKFKLILSFFIILIHCPILKSVPLLSWELSFGISRIAVPCFFLINGYYLVKAINNPRKIKRYLLHLAFMYLTWGVIYLPFAIDGFLVAPSFAGLLRLPNYHLWYIASLIIGTAGLFYIKNLIRNDRISDIVCLIMSLGLLLFGILSEKIELFHGELPQWLRIARRYICLGFPFIFAGYAIGSRNLDKHVIKNSYTLIGVIGLLIIGLLFEAGYSFLFSGHNEFYLFQIVVSPLLFILVLRYSSVSPSDGYFAHMSTSVYLVHVMFINFAWMLFGSMDSTGQYILVALFSLLASHCIVELNKRIPVFF